MSEENEIIETDEPKDEVEGHKTRISQNDEPATDTDDEVEAHSVRFGTRSDGKVDGKVD